MANQEEIYEELNKLKKSDLIQIIITKKVSSDFKISEKVKTIIENSKQIFTCGNNMVVNDLTSTNSTDKVSYFTIQNELKCNQVKLECSARLITELERTIKNQELIISLLKNDRNCDTNKSFNTVATSSTINSSIGKNKKSLSIMENENDNGDVIHKSANSYSKSNLSVKNQSVTNNRNKIWGANDSLDFPCSDDTFSGAVKRLWLHVGKVTIGTQVSQIEKYLNKKFPDNKFTVDELPLHPEAKTMSFKVGADFSLLEDLYNGAVWPKGVMIQKFKFRKNFFRSPSQNQPISQFE